MEESQEEWKGYIIVKNGPYWRVRNCNRYVGGTFNMLDKGLQAENKTTIPIIPAINPPTFNSSIFSSPSSLCTKSTYCKSNNKS